MSVQTPETPPTPPPVPSFAFPMAILVACVIEVVFTLAKLVLPANIASSEKYYLVATGIWTCSALLFTMGFAELARRLSPRQAAGAQIAMIATAALLGLILAGGLMNFALSSFSGNAEVIWKMQQYLYCAAYLAVAVGLIIAAGGFARVAPAAIGLVVLSIVLAPPPFLSTKIYDLLGTSYRYVYIAVNLGQLALQAYLIRQAAHSSTRDLPAEPTAPFALLGSALRARVIAMFILIAFTVFAIGGRSVGAMKVAMVGAPLVNLVAFLIFAIAALRAGRGLDAKLQAMFGIAAAAAAWCAGVLSMQTPALYEMLGGADSYSRERNTELAQALSIAMPMIATLGVVIALLAVGSHIRRLGHHAVAETVAPRTTVFVILMGTSVLMQLYVVQEAKSVGQFIFLGLISAGAGVVALLVAANVFKRASEATSTTALPTATMLS